MIYIEVLFVLNCWIDFYLLFFTGKILKKEISFKRIITASLIGGLSTLLLFLKNDMILIILKLIICIVMQLISFNAKNIKELIEEIIYFYLLSIILAGVILLLKERTISIKKVYITLFISTPIILYLYKIKDNKLKSTYNNIHNVELYIDNKKYKFKALYDTGNKLYDQYKKRPISILYTDKIILNYENSIIVPMNTVNRKSILKCIVVDKMIIDNKYIKYKQLVGIINEKINLNDINMILHSELLGG